MMRMFGRCLLLVALVSPSLAFAEDVENPVYSSWAKVPVKTVVTHKIEGEAAGQKTETIITKTLKELKNDVATVETVTIIIVAGQEIRQPATEERIKKMLPLPSGVKKEDFNKPKGTTETGTETLKIGGTEYKTTWFKAKSTFMGGNVESQTWISDDVPGQLVKSETKISGTVTSSQSLKLVEVKKP